MNCTADQRARVIAAIVGASSSAPELVGVSNEVNSANLSWCKDLLPVILTWIV
jgi:hypothetical protein